MPDFDDAKAEAERLGVGSYDRHIFICTGPDCCTTEEGAASWTALKSAVAELNGSGERGRVNRTKVGCLRICRQGPVGVVYPEGRWYAGLDPAAIARVVTEDLGHGVPVADHLIGQNPLAPLGVPPDR